MLMQLLRALVRRLLRLTGRWAVEVVHRSRYYFRERFQKEIHTYPGGARHDSGLWCIFAHRQGPMRSANLAAYFAALNEARYNIVLVNNGSLESDLANWLAAQCHTLIVKSYGGRDFASYQIGTRLLRELAARQPIKQVIYCNESVFVRPTALVRLLHRVRQADAPYIGLTGSFVGAYHVSSWFFAISGSLFENPVFTRYWERYKPYSSRMHAITHGEIGLSVYLCRRGFNPEILFDPKDVVDALFALEPPRRNQLLQRLTAQHTWHQIRNHMMGTENSAVPEAALSARLLRVVADDSELHNSTNLYNLLMMELCDFPFIKKDLVYRNDYFLHQIQDAVAGWTEPDNAQAAEIIAFFRARGAMRWQGGVRGYLTREGFI